MVECTLSITHCLQLNLQLHTIDLVSTCRISSFCTVAWQLARFQLTRRIARSLGDSWASCRDIAVISQKSPILTHPTCIRRPRSGWPRSNFAEIFGVRKLESLCYRGVVSVILCLAVLVELRLVTDTDTDTDRQTQTDTGPWLVGLPRMHSIAQ